MGDAGCLCDWLPAGGRQTVTDHRSGDLICYGCGVVLEEHMLDERPAWKEASHDPGSDTARMGCGPSTLLPDIQGAWQPDSTLDVRNSKGAAALIPKRLLAKARDDPLGAVRKGYSIIDSFACRMRVGSVVTDVAKQVYLDVHVRKPVRGEVATNVYAAASLYFGCKLQKQEGLSRTEKEIAEICGVNITALNSAHKVFRKVLATTKYSRDLFDSVSSTDLLHRRVDALCLQDDTHRKLLKRDAHAVDADIRKRGVLEGKTPECIATCSILTAMLRAGIPVPANFHALMKITKVTVDRTMKILAASSP